MLLIESEFSVPSTLEYHDQLNPAIFDGEGKMKQDVRNALLRVADSYVETLKPFIDESMIGDIFLTGSNANYNYKLGSDCDVHIMVRFPSEIYEEFALAKKTVWNKNYHVSIHGYPAEIYPQNASEKIVDGSGWYNISRDEWLHKPTHDSSVDVKNPNIVSIAEKYSKQIDFVIKYKVTDMQVLHRLGAKIWGLRDQAKSGEFSVNNLAFKELRNNGWTDKYNDYLQEVQSNQMGV